MTCGCRGLSMIALFRRRHHFTQVSRNRLDAKCVPPESSCILPGEGYNAAHIEAGGFMALKRIGVAFLAFALLIPVAIAEQKAGTLRPALLPLVRPVGDQLRRTHA